MPVITPLCRGGCFLLHIRSFKRRKSQIEKGERSSNFVEIIKKLYSFVWWKARWRATHATPHPSAQRNRTFHTWRAGRCDPRTRFLLEEFTRGGGRRGGKHVKRCHSLTDHRMNCKLKTKIAQYHSAPLLFRQDLSISYWWPLASFGEFIL